MRWARHEVRIEEITNAYKISTRKFEGKDHPKDRRRWRVILKRISLKHDIKM
jgi:hypothetical protein